MMDNLYIVTTVVEEGSFRGNRVEVTTHLLLAKSAEESVGIAMKRDSDRFPTLRPSAKPYVIDISDSARSFASGELQRL